MKQVTRGLRGLNHPAVDDEFFAACAPRARRDEKEDGVRDLQRIDKPPVCSCIISGASLLKTVSRSVAPDWGHLPPIACPSVDAVDADDGDPEIAQPVEKAVELSLVREVASQGRLASMRTDLELLECAAEGRTQAAVDDDSVPTRVAGVLHGQQAGGCRGGLSPPPRRSTRGGSRPLLGSEQAEFAATGDCVGAAVHP